jgi:phosphoadenosine phosphosulfate reductase
MIDEKRIERSLKTAEEIAAVYGNPLLLGFSGGKDSIVLKHYADKFKIRYVARYNNTQIERDDTLHFIQKYYPDVQITYPKKENSFFVQMRKHGLPSIFRRWCCEVLKHSNPQNIELTGVFGVRGEESRKRKERGAVSVLGKSKRAQRRKEEIIKLITDDTEPVRIDCYQGKDKNNIYPIFDLTECEVWHIIKENNLITPPHAYTNGRRRMGCMLCPYSSKREMKETVERYPSIKRNWLKVFEENDCEFMKERQKILTAKYDITPDELFHLYITKSLLASAKIDQEMSKIRGLFRNQ